MGEDRSPLSRGSFATQFRLGSACRKPGLFTYTRVYEQLGRYEVALRPKQTELTVTGWPQTPGRTRSEWAGVAALSALPRARASRWQRGTRAGAPRPRTGLAACAR